MGKGMLTQRPEKERGLCFVALSIRNEVMPLMVSIESLIRQLQQASSESTVKEITITQDRKIQMYLSDEPSEINLKEIDVKQEGIHYVEAVFKKGLVVSAAIQAFKRLNHSLSVMKMKHNLNKIQEITILDSKLSVRTTEEVKQEQPKSDNVVPIRNEKLLLIDGSNLLSRGYFATSQHGSLMQTKDGRYTNAVYSMVNSFFSLLKKHKPTHVSILWDMSRSTTFRRLLYAEYKGTRGETEPALKEQFETAQELFKSMNVPQMMKEGLEADDLIGILARKFYKEKEGPIYMVSSDKDLFQLLNDRTSQLLYRKGEEVCYTADDFKEEYGLNPDQWSDVKGLLGETGDNIPGVRGVGDKAAIPMLQKFGSIQGIYHDLSALEIDFKRYVKKLEEGKESAFLSKQLATIVTEAEDVNVDLESIRIKMDKKGTLDAFRQLEFDSLLEKIS
jgi:5'-3' exonuclease